MNRPLPALRGIPAPEQLPEPGRQALFATHREGQLRTVGTLFLLPELWPHLEDWTGSDAQALSRMFDPRLLDGSAAARGKLMLIEPTLHQAGVKRCGCFQVTLHEAAKVFCGNSTAALGALAAQSGVPRLSLQVFCGSVFVAADVSAEVHGDVFTVAQRWSVHPDSVRVEPAVVGPYRGARCRLLNDYLVLDAPADVTAEDIIDLLDRDIEPDEKIVVLDHAGQIPRARFFTVNGLHGAAPQTGLAMLGLMSQHEDWLAAALQGGVLETPSGHESLLTIPSPHHTYVFDMPEVEVQLDGF